MRYLALIFAILVALVGCTNKAETKKELVKSWQGPFGTQMGLTKDQLLPYGDMTPLDQDEQQFLSSDVPNNYGMTYDRIVYQINSVEGLCAISVEFNSVEQANTLQEILESHYGKPAIEKPEQFITWDRPSDKQFPVIILNYNKQQQVVRVFYSNYDRCHLK